VARRAGVVGVSTAAAPDLAFVAPRVLDLAEVSR
jgi:hypothetical protein